MRQIFYSSLGLRSGWALALFLSIYSGLTLGAQFSFANVSSLRDWAARQPHGVIAPVAQIEFTGLELLILLLAAAITAWAQERPLSWYGLNGRGRGFRRFCQGGLFGLAMATLLIGVMFACGGYSVAGMALPGAEIAKNGILYAIGFGLVAFFEECVFRGLLQTILQQGIGVWPSAIVLALAFGAIHLPNL